MNECEVNVSEDSRTLHQPDERRRSRRDAKGGHRRDRHVVEASLRLQARLGGVERRGRLELIVVLGAAAGTSMVLGREVRAGGFPM